MPAFLAASGSFHVKSSFTSLVIVFVTVRLLPFFSTVTLIRSSTLIVSTFGARSYTDQRYWSIHSSVRTHSSEASSGLTFAHVQRVILSLTRFGTLKREATAADKLPTRPGIPIASLWNVTTGVLPGLTVKANS